MRAYAERRGLVPESEIVLREPAAAEHIAPARPRRGMFAGLKLAPSGSSPPAGRGAFPGISLSPAGSRQTPVPPSVGVPTDRLAEAAELYAGAWTGIERMRAQGLPVLEGQRAAIRDAGAALDKARPGSVTDLTLALRYDRQTQAAMIGLSGQARGTALVAGMEREAQARADPAVRAARYVASWKELEATHARHDGWDQAETRAGIAARMQTLSGVIARDRHARAAMAAEPTRFGIKQDTLFMEIIQGRSLEKTARDDLSRRVGVELDRGHGLNRSLGRGARGPEMGM